MLARSALRSARTAGIARSSVGRTAKVQQPRFIIGNWRANWSYSALRPHRLIRQHLMGLPHPFG